MRTLLKVTVPVEKGSEALNSGALGQTIQSTMEQLKPEASYLYAEDGKRTGFFVFDMERSWQLPPMLEPVFQNLDASVTVTPVRNAEDLERGLKEAAS